MEIERQTAREEIAELRAHVDKLEHNLEALAVERAKGVKGIPYSYEMKRGPYKDWKDWKDLGE